MPTVLSPEFFSGSIPIAVVYEADGFVGSNLCERLLERGVKVLAIGSSDNLSETIEKIQRAEYVFYLSEFPDKREIAQVVDLAKSCDARFLAGFPYAEENLIAETRELCQKRRVDFRISLWLDVVGPRIDEIFIPSTQEEAVYPVFVGDVVDGIVKAQLAPGTNASLFAFAGEKTSSYTLSQLIENSYPELKVLAKKGTRSLDEGQLLSGRRQISWEAKTSIREALAKTQVWFEKNKHKPKVQRTEKIAAKPKIEEKPETKTSFWARSSLPVSVQARSSKRRWFFFPLFALAILFWVFLFPVFQFAVGTWELKHARFGNSVFWFDMAKNSFLSWGSVPGLKNEATSFSEKSKQLSLFARLGANSTQVLDKVEDLRKALVGKEPYDQKGKIESIKLELTSIERELGFLDAELKGDIVMPFGNTTLLEKDVISDTRRKISFLSSMLANFPEITGQEGKKTYAVILVDNTTLRPAGGLVGSFAIASFEKGRLTNLEVTNAISADALLRGQVDPPAPLATYAGLANWDLANSGWSADFATSASRAGWFIEKELEQKVDGVLGYDLETVRLFLENLGPLELETNDKVTADNIYLRAAGESREFLNSLNRAFLKKLTGEQTHAEALLPVFRAAVGKHLAVWSQNAKTQNSFAQFNWDGGVEMVTCSLALKFGNCKTDYLQIVDSNMGPEKISHQVTKTHSLEIDIKESVLSHRMTVNVANKAAQTYKSYLRFLVPATTRSNLLTLVNPKTGEQTRVTPEEGTEKGKRTFSLYVQIPAGENRQIVFLWDVPTGACPEELCDEGELVFLWQKQKGTGEEAADLRINLPEAGLKVGAYPEPGLTESSTIGYNIPLSEDFLTNIVWQPK